MGKKHVTIPKKMACYIENAKSHYHCRHNILAYALHAYSVDKKELSKEQALIMVEAVYEGYNTK